MHLKGILTSTGVGRESAVGTGWEVRGSNPGEDKIFRNRPDRSWGPFSLLDKDYRFFPGGKADGVWRHPTTLIVMFMYSYCYVPF